MYLSCYGGYLVIYASSEVTARDKLIVTSPQKSLI